MLLFKQTPTMIKIMEFLKLTPLYEIILPYAQKKELSDWYKKGKTPPSPQLIKQQVIKEYALKYSAQIFVETGTYLGSTIDAVKGTFDRIFTIELDKLLFQRAQKKFKKYQHITVLQGDSAKVLPKVLKKIIKPAIFWLDAHYSKGITARGREDTPIMNELKFILNHHIKSHTILIDDAHMFKGEGDYTSIQRLKSSILKRNPNYKFRVRQNIIVIQTR